MDEYQITYVDGLDQYQNGRFYKSKASARKAFERQTGKIVRLWQGAELLAVKEYTQSYTFSRS